MLTLEDYRIWCERLQLPPETEVAITAIRSAQPGRTVKGCVGDVAGRYPSPKMGRSIQFESRHVELWAIYGMERDDDVPGSGGEARGNSRSQPQGPAPMRDHPNVPKRHVWCGRKPRPNEPASYTQSPVHPRE